MGRDEDGGTEGWMRWHGMGWDGFGRLAGLCLSVSCACVTVSPVEPPSVGLDGLANPGCCGWRPVRQAT